MLRLLAAVVLISACGIPEGQYESEVHGTFCERVAECNPLLSQEECMLIPPDHIGLECAYDAGVALECRTALTETECTVDDVTGASWFEEPEVCELVWVCD